MEDLALKIRLAVLWLFVAVGMSAYFTLFLMLPGVTEGIIAGEVMGTPIDEASLFIYVLFWLIPLTMAFLSLILKDSANRWANIVVGIGLAIVGIMMNLSSGYTSIAHHLIDVSMYVVLALIVWYAWKLPKQGA